MVTYYISREEFIQRDLHVLADRVITQRWKWKTRLRLILGNHDKDADEWLRQWIDDHRAEVDAVEKVQADAAFEELRWWTQRLRRGVYRVSLALELAAVAALVLIPLPIWPIELPLYSLSAATGAAFIADYVRSKNKFWIARSADGHTTGAGQLAYSGGYTWRKMQDVI